MNPVPYVLWFFFNSFEKSENSENSGGFTDFVALNSCNDDISSRLIDNQLSRESVSVRKCCLLVSIITFKGLILETALACIFKFK